SGPGPPSLGTVVTLAAEKPAGSRAAGKPGNLCSRVAELRQDLLRVLAGAGHVMAESRALVVERNRQPGQPCRPPTVFAVGQRHLEQPAACGQVRVLEHLLGPFHRCEWQAQSFELFDELLHAVAADGLADDRNDPVALANPVRIAHEALVTREVTELEGFAEGAPLPIRDDPDEYRLLLGGLEYLVDSPRRNTGRHWRRRRAGHGELRHVLPHQEHGALEECSGNLAPSPRALALEYGSEYAQRTEHATLHVDDGGPGAQRPPRRTRHVRKPAHHLRHFVKRRPLRVRPLQEALLRAVDEPWISGREGFVA